MFRNFYARIGKNVANWLTYEPPATESIPYDFSRLKHEVKQGDVLLIQGRSHISRIIRTLTQSSWTHAALYIGRQIDFEDEKTLKLIRQHVNVKPNARLIIEDTLDKGTSVSLLSSYKNHHIRICRPIGITHTDTHLVINYAIKALGQPYNVRHIIDLARFVLPWSILPRRWGSSLFRTVSGEIESGICSSLIAEAFISVQFPILPYIKMGEENQIEMFHRNPYLFTPKDFDFSPYFEIIKYPLFNPEQPLPYYRRMPWSTSGMVHQDNGILSGAKKKDVK